MRKIIFLLFTFSLFSLSVFADDFYWVNNGGNWTDFQNHWATTSNGSTMHTRVPNELDNVYFDANSFNTLDQVVFIDTSFISCGILDWQSVGFKPEFLGTSIDTMVIQNQLIFPAADQFYFSYFGLIIFKQSIPAQTLVFQPNNYSLSANIIVDINSGELSVDSDLKMQQRNLIVYNGKLNLNSHNLFVKHLNADTILSNPAIVVSPSLKDIDTLTCSGSLHFVNTLDITEFDAVLYFASKSVDSNYINFENHFLNSEFNFTTKKKYFLLSDLKTSKELYFDLSGKFYSQDHEIMCKLFSSMVSHNRTIDLGTSDIYLSGFELNNTGSTFISQNANLNYSGVDDFYFYTNKTNLEFNLLKVGSSSSLYWYGDVILDSVSLVAGVNFFIDGNSTLVFNDLDAVGDCGNYIQIRAICDESIQDENVCVGVLPVFRSSNVITVDYLKLSNIEADGDFTASNSFNEGGNVGWIIIEPNAVSTLYWIGNTGVWNDYNNWSASSGGGAQSCIPSRSTNVVFDDNSFSGNDTVKLNDIGYCAAMTWKDIDANPVFDGNGKLVIKDSILFDPLVVADFSGKILMKNNSASDTIKVETNGVILNAQVEVNGNAFWDFVDPVTIHNELIFSDGGLLFTGESLTVENFISDVNDTRTFNIEKTEINLIGQDTVWNLDKANLVFTSDSSDIYILNASPKLNIFKGDGANYFNLFCNSNYVKLEGDNSFNMLTVLAGNTVEFEEGSQTYLDSLDAVADCQHKISFISRLQELPAKIRKTGYDNLVISDFFLNNIVADTLGGVVCEANTTSREGDVSGWIFNDTLPGKTFYWLGNNSNWHDITNWQVDGLPATCLPTINDTVFVDPVLFSAATSKSIDIDRIALCHDFIAIGLDPDVLTVNFSSNLFVKSSLVLNDSVKFYYSDMPDLSEAEDYNFGVFCIPSTSFDLNPALAKIAVNIYINSSQLATPVYLLSDLNIDTVASLIVLSGTFEASNSNIKCGFFKTGSQALKNINIDKSNIEVFANLEIQDNSILNFSADSSFIEFNGNSLNFSKLDGGGQTFFDVKFQGNILPPDDELSKDLIVFVVGENFYNTFSVFDGVILYAQSSKVQTVDSAFIIRGTCQNYVSLLSLDKGTRFSFKNNNTITDTIICAIIEDSEFLANAVAILSFDEGNNSGWTFDATKAADANFTIPYPACIGDELTFINNSVSMYGGQTNLNFEWYVEQDTVPAVIDLPYSFFNAGDFKVSLLATDVITGCDDLFIDTLTLYNHNVILSVNDGNIDACDGETFTFTAQSDNATEFEYYLNGVWVDLGDPTQNVFSANYLIDGDSVWVNAIYHDCVKTSDTLVVTVYSSPVVVLNCSDADTTICVGDNISFVASGAETYSFLLNGSPIGAFDSINTYSSNVLADLSVISVVGQSVNGCQANSLNEFTVNVLPNPTVDLTADVDPPTICSGDTITLNSTGAHLYEFFINGLSTGVASSQDFLETDFLVNDDVVTVIGTDIHGCSSISSGIMFEVNISPDPLLTCTDLDTVICLGDEVTFYGNGADEYQFYIDGTSQGAFSSTNSLISNSLTHGQFVSLWGRIGTCVREADPMVFDVFPVIDLNASDIEICPGDNITFTASGDTIYQFFVDGNPVTTLGSNPVFSSGLLVDGQIVTVQGTPGACEPDGITITVNPLPSVSLVCSEADTAICVGDLVTFNASGAYEYEFFVDGASQGVASTISYFNISTLSNGQEVTVVGNTSYGCSATSVDIFDVTVYDYPVVSLTDLTGVTEICKGDTLSFSASGADDYLFYISTNPQGVFSNVSDFETADVTNGATVSVHGKTNGCVAIAPETYTYTVYNLPIVKLIPETPISVCEKDTIRLKATGASEYEFFVNNVSQGVPDPNNFFESTLLSDNDVITVVGYQNICYANGADTVTVDVNQVPDLVFDSNISETAILLNFMCQVLLLISFIWTVYLMAVLILPVSCRFLILMQVRLLLLLVIIMHVLQMPILLLLLIFFLLMLIFLHLLTKIQFVRENKLLYMLTEVICTNSF